MSNVKMRVAVSKKCIGAGLCISVAPEHFEFYRGRARGTGKPMDRQDSVDSVSAAVDVCPAAAITIVQAQSRTPNTPADSSDEASIATPSSAPPTFEGQA